MNKTVATAIFTLQKRYITCLIVLAKCLSPSHAALGYSLYEQYQIWRKSEQLPCSSFKGFQHNRFGRTGFLATLFLQQREDLVRFWDEFVDENSNLLVLAIHAYLSNEWFIKGCSVYQVWYIITNRQTNTLFISFYYYEKWTVKNISKLNVNTERQDLFKFLLRYSTTIWSSLSANFSESMNHQAKEGRIGRVSRIYY